jgi:hypothetical protein
MKRSLAMLSAVALASALAGCGDTCTTKGTEVAPTTNPAAACDGKAVAPDTTVTVSVKPACKSCADSEPHCDISPLAAGQLQLDVKVKECDANKGCGVQACAFSPVTCTFTLAASASGPLDIVYLTAGGTQTATVTVGGTSPVTSCSI